MEKERLIHAPEKQTASVRADFERRMIKYEGLRFAGKEVESCFDRVDRYRERKPCFGWLEAQNLHEVEILDHFVVWRNACLLRKNRLLCGSPD